MSSIQALISSKIRIEILNILTRNPGSSFHINEMSRRTGFSIRGVERELKKLLSGGILKREVLGNQHRYRLDPACPILEELKTIFLKTVGLTEVLRAALNPVKEKIELASVFGSFASGDYGNQSDVDLLVVSDLSGVRLAELLGPVQNEIGRSINVSQFSPVEYRRRLEDKDHFLLQVTEGPRITIIGPEDES